MEQITKFFQNINHLNIIKSVVLIIGSIILYKIIAHILDRYQKKNKFKLFTSKKSSTYIKLLKSIIRYIFIIITVLVVLQINGVNVNSALTGVGILGVVFGFAIQDWLKDIIRGSSILSDNYFSVGDIVKYKDIEGKVIVIGLKTTKIQDLKTRNVISIANRNIEQIEVVSKLVYIDIPMPYEVTVKKAEKIVNDIIENIKTNNNVETCRYLSVNDLADSYIKYLIEVTCDPSFKLQVRRDAFRSILEEFENNKIAVPYTQIDIHQK